VATLSKRRTSPRASTRRTATRSRFRRTRERVSVEAQNDRSLTWTHFCDRAEGKSAAPLRRQRTAANDDLVGVIGVALAPNVIEPADGRTVARHHSVAHGSGQQATEFRLPSQP